MKKFKKTLGTLSIVIAVLLIVFTFKEDSDEMNLAEQEVDRIKSGFFRQGEYLLEIPSINLALPVKNGAEHENMIGSAATILRDEIEEGKNFSIAGHRSIRFGKNFNRLGEIQNGDVIYVKEDGKEYAFVVTEMDVVEPHEVHILDDSGETEITLVTCHPIGISSHRLYIKGVLLNEE